MKEHKNFPAKKTGKILVNLSGILSALAIAFGGLFLVQLKLNQEQEKLLTDSGLIELPQTEIIEVTEAGDLSLSVLLTEEQLEELRNILEVPGETALHEPLSGQLSMAQAIECGRTWLKDFFLPRLGTNENSLSDYKASCYLWAPESPDSEPENRPWLSCWTISLSNQHIEAVLILNAVTGQILEASVSCFSPIEYQEQNALMTLLEDFASSFGMDNDSRPVYSAETESGAKKLPWYQRLGTRGTFASIQASSIIVCSTDTDTDLPLYTEQFNIHLYLSPGPEMQ